MPFFMSHPDNGFTNAYSNEEVVALEKLGWKRDVFKPKAQMLAEAATQNPIADPDEVPDPAEDIDVLRSVYEAKHGSAPDKRWSVKTLQKEVG